MSETLLGLTRIDHIVLTCMDIDLSEEFYRSIMGLDTQKLPDGRVEVLFGQCKINLQPAGRHYGPSRNQHRQWNGNLCMLTEQPVELIAIQLLSLAVEIEEGPVEKTGALGPIRSIYFRDPDDNLLEVSNQILELS